MIDRAFPLSSGQGSALRLFLPGETSDQPGQLPPGLSADLPLSVVFERYFVPDVMVPLGLDAKTVQSYRESIAWWVKLTTDPPVGDVRREHATLFSNGLQAQKGRRGETLALYTVKKHCVQVQKVLNWCGPDGEEDRDGDALLDRVPRIKHPRVIERDPECFDADELKLILEACRHMRTPQIPGVHPADWWTALYTFGYYEALRLGTLLALEYSWIQGNKLAVPGTAMKGKRGITLLLLPESIRAINAIRTNRKLVFEWNHCPRWLHSSRERLLRKAGLPEHRWLGFHGLRKTNATELTLINAFAAQISMGHRQSETTTRHYVNPKILYDSKKKLPKLEAKFTSLDHQKRLF